MTIDTPIDVAKLVHEHLAAFHKHYKLPRHFDDEPFLEWCKSNLGRQYRDWTFYKGHPKDTHCVIHIKDPKWCVLFELTWTHLIIGQLDIK
jgi:hypothetical protein